MCPKRFWSLYSPAESIRFWFWFYLVVDLTFSLTADQEIQMGFFLGSRSKCLLIHFIPTEPGNLGQLVLVLLLLGGSGFWSPDRVLFLLSHLEPMVTQLCSGSGSDSFGSGGAASLMNDVGDEGGAADCDVTAPSWF